jgi:hypothetical protein
VVRQVFLKVPARFPPWSLRILGEKPLGRDAGSVALSASDSASDDDVRRIKELFPEIDVWDHREERKHDTAPVGYDAAPSRY